MKNVTLGGLFANTGTRSLQVGDLALGIARFGAWNKMRENHAQLDRFVGCGGNLIDTALVYGRWTDETQTSYSEQIYGEWLAIGDNRTKTVTATKGAHPLPYTTSPRVNAACIADDVAESLLNLKCKTVDLYFLHRDDETVPVSEIMDELNRHADRGALNLLGASNWSAERIYRANDYCVCHGMRGFDVSQICFNLMRPTPKMLGDVTLVSMTDEEAGLYHDMQMPIMAFTAQAGGFVSKYIDTPVHEISSRYASEDNLQRLERIRVLCRDTGLTPTEVTLGYLYGQASTAVPLTVIPVTSVSNDRQMDDVIASSAVSLTPEQIAWIDGI